MRLKTLATLAALGAAPAFPATSADPATVEPAFAWPPDLRASLTFTQVGREPGKASIEFGSQCALRSKAHAKGLLISCRNAKISNEVGGELPTISDYLRTAAEFDWVVTRRGEFVGLTNRPFDGRALEDAGAVPAEPAGTLRLEPMMLSVSEAEARSTWAMLVENWTGTSLTLGELVSGESASELPLVPGVSVHRRDSVNAERWLPCPGRPHSADQIP